MVLPPFNLAATGSRSVGTPVPGGLGLLTFPHAVSVCPGYDSIKTLPVWRQIVGQMLAFGAEIVHSDTSGPSWTLDTRFPFYTSVE